MATITGSQRLLDLDGNNFTTSVTLGAGGTLLDSDGQAGTKGQILSSTGGATNWIEPASFTNNFVSGISFNTVNGILTLTRSGLGDLTVDLDGRYLTSASNFYLDGISKSGNKLTFSVSGATNQAFEFGSNAFNSTTIYAEPGIFSGGGTPTLASGVTAAEIRSLIGAGTGSGSSNLVIGITSTTAMAGNTTTITAAQATAIDNNTKKVSDTGTPAVLSNGSTPSLNSGITAAEMRSVIGAGTGSGSSNLVIGTTSTTAKAGNIVTITTTQSGNITTNNDKVSDTGTPAVLSNGTTPSLNSGISSGEMRTLIGAGTGNSNLAIGSTSTTAKAGDTTTISGTQAANISTNNDRVTDSGTPAILSNGTTPTLNSGISAGEVRSLIGAGTSSSAGVTRVRGTANRIGVTSGTDPIVNAITGTVTSGSTNLATGAQIQTAINTAVTGVLKYKGTWNAETNTPTLESAKGVAGEYYIVSTKGDTDLDGIREWAVGDWAVFSDQATDAWQKIDNTQVGNVTGSGSNGRVAFWNGDTNITSDSDLTFNGSNLSVGGTVGWSGGGSAESNTAYDRSITGFSDSGSATTTLTLTRQDGVTITTSFSNPQGTVTGGPYTELNQIRSLGTQAFTNGANPNITTAQVMAEIEADGGFDSYSSVFKTSWSYAGNYNLTDAGRFTETAGSSWITWTDNSSDAARGNITTLAVCPTTGGSAGQVFIYNDQGSGYAPGWREVWTSTSDGSGSGLDADKLDGQEGSYYYPASNPTGFTANTGTVTSIATSTGLSGGTITTSGTLTNTDRGSQQAIFKTITDGATKITASNNSDTLTITGCKGTNVNYNEEAQSIEICADQQTLSISGTTLTLSDGGAVTLPTSTGPKGDKGNTGDTGIQGPQGDKGDKGNTGDAGGKGDTGDAGAKGDKGNTGDTGSAGSAGAKGDKGDTGDTGSQGPRGLQGEGGDTGGKGNTGDAGAKGDTGSAGGQGPQGDPGAKGDTGGQGAKGDTGNAGSNGSDGKQGDKGDTGNAGSNGSNGSNGAKGDTGDPGKDGSNGAAGARGATGSVGSQGAKGNTGNQGTQGIQGIQGVKGDQGGTGSTGSTGPRGLPGSDAEVSGYSGDLTVQGARGTMVLMYENGLLKDVKF